MHNVTESPGGSCSINMLFKDCFKLSRYKVKTRHNSMSRPKSEYSDLSLSISFCFLVHIRVELIFFCIEEKPNKRLIERRLANTNWLYTFGLQSKRQQLHLTCNLKRNRRKKIVKLSHVRVCHHPLRVGHNNSQRGHQGAEEFLK